MAEKQCFKCKAVKPLEDFYKHPAMADGRVNKCKECNKVDVRENRTVKADYYRAYDRERGSRQPPEYIKEYRARYPKKYKAHSMVNYHVRAGNISKKPCEICGDFLKAEAHHDDYDKPLDVRWLCSIHHKAWHQEHGEGINA
jgi:hypothetical protein